MFFKNLQYLLSLFLLVALLTGAGFSGQQPGPVPKGGDWCRYPAPPEWEDQEEQEAITPGNYWLEPDHAQVL